MRIAVGTSDGVWEASDRGIEQRALAGKRVTHVARSGDTILAAVPKDGVYLGQERIFEGDARSCAVGPDGALWAGVEPAMLFRSSDAGASWSRSDAIDKLPTRADWTFPPPPHQPHVLSIDFLPEEPDTVLAGVEVGGALLSPDGGDTWSEINEGIYVDVHSLRPDPSAAGALYAVTGRGFYASENSGRSWERRMEGMGNGYTIGMHVRPGGAREILVTSGDRPPGLNGRIYHSTDAGRTWVELTGPGLPEESRRAPVPLFAAGAAWLGTDTGRLLRAEDPRKDWTLVHEFPSSINAVAADGSPSSVMH